MGRSEDFPAHKAFTAACDRVFLLEAEGRPALELASGVGGYTNEKDSYAILQPVRGDWSALERGATYALRPRNASVTHRWRMSKPLSVVP